MEEQHRKRPRYVDLQPVTDGALQGDPTPVHADSQDMLLQVFRAAVFPGCPPCWKLGVRHAAPWFPERGAAPEERARSQVRQ